jgi:hypothetical protein
LLRDLPSDAICCQLRTDFGLIAVPSPSPISFTICLRFLRNRVIDVVTVITAKGDHMTSITEETGTAPATATGDQPKPTKKASVAKRARHVAPAKSKSAKKASPAKKAPKGAKKAGSAKAGKAREGSKTAEILDLLKRSGGATLAEIMKTAGWQAHSVRGFISGTLRKKMGLGVSSTKGEDDERSYSLKG